MWSNADVAPFGNPDVAGTTIVLDLCRSEGYDVPAVRFEGDDPHAASLADKVVIVTGAADGLGRRPAGRWRRRARGYCWSISTSRGSPRTRR